MLKHAFMKAVAGFVAVVLGTGLAVSTSALAASAVAAPTDQCIINVIHHPEVLKVEHPEYQYTKTIPGTTETFHTEYRFATRTPTYGYVEHKYINSSWDFVDGGTTTVNGHLVSGHWVNTGATFWHAIADSVINAYWGAGGIDDNLIGGSQASPKGTVPLSVYGAAGAGSADYYATKVLEATGFTDYGPWSGWSTTNPGAATSTLKVETRSVSNNDGTPASTVYYVHGGAPTTTVGAVNWTTDTLATVQALDAAWVLHDQRIVVDVAAVAAWDENVYGTCPTKPCVSQSSTWFTEAGDVAPTQTSGGLLFTGPNVPAVDYLHLVSGNLMGVIGTSYTITSAGGYHAALVYEIWRYGTTGFATISIEPYNNGWAPGQTGTFTVTAATKVWTSKIANPALGSQANPATIAEMSVIFPDNELLAQGIHLGTNSVAGQFTVVSKITGCGGVTFLQPPTLSCLANSTGSTLTLPAITGVSWKVNGGAAVVGPVVVPLSQTDVTVQAVPTSSAYLFGPGQTSWTFDAGPDGFCQFPTLAQFPTNVTHTDQQCVNGKLSSGGTITVGQVGGTAFFTNEVDYFFAGSLTPMTQQTVSVVPGTYAITASPHDPDDTLTGATSWSVTVAPATAVCGDLTTLALTGSTSPVPWGLLGLGLIAAGLAVVVVQMARRSTEIVE